MSKYDDTEQAKEIKKIVCDRCYTAGRDWVEGKSAIPFSYCSACVPKVKTWLISRGWKLPDKPAVNPGNPFPHPENRGWHPQAVPFATLAVLVFGGKDNQWRDDVTYYMARQAREEPSQFLDFITGLKGFLNQLEKRVDAELGKESKGG